MKENKDEFHGEYLGIDCMYIDEKYKDKAGKLLIEDWCPPVPPSVVIEHENDYSRGKILYCLWKILCVRADTKILICYQSNADRVKTLVEHCEKFIWEGGFMKNENSDLLLIVGDHSKIGSDWMEYFSVFEWRSDRLEKIVLEKA